MLSYELKISVFCLILLLLFERCVGEQNESCENSNRKSRIAAGYRPPVHTLPKYIVSIRNRNEPSNRFGCTHFCAGSIISPNRILTAAHCVVKIDGTPTMASSIKIVAKTPTRLKKTVNTQEVNVINVIAHRHFQRSTLFNDIALLILENDITLDGHLAEIIQLPRNNVKDYDVCTVIGWGKLYLYGPLANDVVYVDLAIQSRRFCIKKHAYYTRKKLCAIDKNDHEKDSCMGDSGGPVICNGTLTGIVSYGYGCTGGIGSIYTNVYKYMDWIARDSSNLLKSFVILHFLTLTLIIVYL